MINTFYRFATSNPKLHKLEQLGVDRNPSTLNECVSVFESFLQLLLLKSWDLINQIIFSRIYIKEKSKS